MAAHFQEHVYARAFRGFADARDDVSLRGVKRFVRAHFNGQLAAMRIHFRGKDHGGAASARDVDSHQADRPGAGDDHILRGDFSGQHGVHRVSERIQNRGVVLGNRRINFPDIADGNNYEFGEAAVGVYPDDFHILADVRLAHAAGAAVSAIDMHFGADEVARLHGGDFGADFFHMAAELVAERHRRMNARSGPAVPAVNVQVGAANGSGAHADQNFDGPRRGNRDGFELRSALGTHLAQSFHRGCGHRVQAEVQQPAKFASLAHASEKQKSRARGRCFRYNRGGCSGARSRGRRVELFTAL